MTHRLLLLNGDREAPIRLAEADPGIALVALTSPRHRHRYSPATPVGVVDDLADLAAVRREASALAAEHRIDSVAAATEHSVQAAGYLSDLFGFRGLGYPVANRLSNKLAMKDALRRARLPVADFTRLDSLAQLPEVIEELGPDLILKPGLGSGTEYAVRILGGRPDPAARLPVRALMARPGPVIAERLLDVGAEYHVDGVVQEGVVRFVSAARYLTPLIETQSGAVTGAELLPPREPEAVRLHELHDRVIRALGVTDAVTHLEAYEVDGRLVVGEIAGRPGGAGVPGALRECYGVDIWRAFLDVAVGRPVAAGVRAGGPHVVWLLLPATEGELVSVTTAEQLRAVPGVVHAEVHAAPGTVAAPRYSTSSLGTVIGRAGSAGEVPALVERVLAAFRSTTRFRVPQPSRARLDVDAHPQ